ncbi:unnamed protein product [Staurois parvus]|uniref:Uncharacterized protein n=3 Tax=Staurois parvus TaxID=386267 RepID=A0ABN9D6J0_9NEOB|nr:unnamed protein product [Staurois parvus]CAI9590997.1 unnamed protein product [Staurois parvus]
MRCPWYLFHRLF